MSRRLVWLQLLIGWFPLWVLTALIIIVVHGVSHGTAILIALRMTICAALLGILVERGVRRFPWPARVTPTFVFVHSALSVVYAISWLISNSVVESVIRRAVVITIGPSASAFLVTGIWFYIMIAGVSYTMQASERALKAEANAATAQLATLRGQLNPHFLFNAMHSVVQLIPSEPARASRAAEQLADLLRTALEEDRDLITVDEELAFVERYLVLERMRFDERLQTRAEVPEALRELLIPSFAIQTLVENAVRHGAAPCEGATTITITAQRKGSSLCISVTDNGHGAATDILQTTNGSGLRRLRDRLAVLYGSFASLDARPDGDTGFMATLDLPAQEAAE